MVTRFRWLSQLLQPTDVSPHGWFPGKILISLCVWEQIQEAEGCKCFLMGAATVSAGGIRGFLRRQGRVPWSPLLFYGLLSGGRGRG